MEYGLTDLSGAVNFSYSLVLSPGNATITGNGSLIGVDPKLGALDVNGGVTQTMLPNAASPAVDAIPTCPDGIDQRTVKSCVNGKMDMGAVERQIPEVIIFRDGFESG
jgi:hypothetical protein